MASEDCICLHIRKADIDLLHIIHNDLKAKYLMQKRTSDNLIDYMVDPEREINLLERQMELKKEIQKEEDDQIQIDMMNNLDISNTHDDNSKDELLLMTSSISKRNLENVDALDTQQLESLKKLRSMGL